MSYIQAILGILVFILIAYIFSEDKSRIKWKMIFPAILLQFAIGFMLTRITILQDILLGFNTIILSLEKATRHGSGFVFGFLGGAKVPFEILPNTSSFIVAFQILPIIIVVSALSSLLFHFGVLQKIISLISWVLKKTLKLDGPTALGVASSIFLGIIESPIFIKPYLNKMSRSSLFTLLTAGMATVAGTVMVLYSSVLGPIMDNAAGQILIASMMSAPAAIMFAQIMIPTDSSDLQIQDTNKIKISTSSSFEAIINGTSEGVSMVISICGVLIVLFTFIELINMALGVIPLEDKITIQSLVGQLFIPFVWLMGIDTEQVVSAGQLMGVKLILNEFVAYTNLAKAPLVGAKSNMIMTYAMCGFANFGSLGILIGGLGGMIPDRKKEVIDLSLKALIAGTLSTMLTGAIAGILF